MASQYGQLETVKYLVQQGCNIHIADSRGFTPLFRATIEDHSEVVKYLIEQGSNVNVVVDNHSTTCLHHASQNGYLAIVTYLVERGCDIDAIDGVSNQTFRDVDSS